MRSHNPDITGLSTLPRRLPILSKVCPPLRSCLLERRMESSLDQPHGNHAKTIIQAAAGPLLMQLIDPKR